MAGRNGFELMESTTPDGDVAKFIEKRGEGVMLISFNVDKPARPLTSSRGRGILYPEKEGRSRRPFRDCEFCLHDPRRSTACFLKSSTTVARVQEECKQAFHGKQ